MAHFPIADLPLELRTIIYKFALSDFTMDTKGYTVHTPDTFYLEVAYESYKPDRGPHLRPVGVPDVNMALTCVSKAIRGEALRVLYGVNAFHFDLKKVNWGIESLVVFLRWFQKRGTSLPRLKHIKIREDRIRIWRSQEVEPLGRRIALYRLFCKDRAVSASICFDVQVPYDGFRPGPLDVNLCLTDEIPNMLEAAWLNDIRRSHRRQLPWQSDLTQKEYECAYNHLHEYMVYIRSGWNLIMD